MGFGFKQPLVGEKRCVTTQITAAKETRLSVAMERNLFSFRLKMLRLELYRARDL